MCRFIWCRGDRRRDGPDDCLGDQQAKRQGRSHRPTGAGDCRQGHDLAQLRRTANADKRVAILFYNYPPGEKNLSASFLNLPKSLANTLTAMKAAGYRTEERDEAELTQSLGRLLAPFYKEGQLQALLDEGLAAWLPMSEYRRWFAAQSPALRAQVLARWGEPEKSSMAWRHKGEAGFVIPRLQLGNVSFMPVPPRGERREDHEAAIYHSTKESINNFYMAAYLWARSNRDALVHFGTHGSQEWTPGKERGLSMDDQPFVVLGDTPVVYPYIVDDVGEALQAKRRGRATIISHQTPSFRPAGLHTELNALHDQLHTWVQQDEGGVKEAIRRDLLSRAAKMHIFEDMAWTRARAEADFAGWINALHAHLHAMAAQLQPYGLHAFGLNKDQDLRLGDRDDDARYRLLQAHRAAGARGAICAGLQGTRQESPFALLRRHLIEGAPTSEIRDAPACRC
ncbi:MAG: cobaltochelatase subunit CobN [Uliginosibacterium sp.]|nr:cobaltochelatase subunit CobN [Uliginosibacterium sp.]